MAMMNERDQPTYYNVVDENGAVLGSASKSKIIALKIRLERETQKKLQIELRA